MRNKSILALGALMLALVPSHQIKTTENPTTDAFKKSFRNAKETGTVLSTSVFFLLIPAAIMTGSIKHGLLLMSTVAVGLGTAGVAVHFTLSSGKVFKKTHRREYQPFKQRIGYENFLQIGDNNPRFENYQSISKLKQQS
jgi:hypothetical protein